MRDARADEANGKTARGEFTRRLAVAVRVVARGGRPADDPPRSRERTNPSDVLATTDRPDTATPRGVPSRADRHAGTPFERGTTTDRRPREVIESTERPSRGWSIDQVIQIASLSGRDAIGTLHVAPSPWPTDGELLRYRQLAAESGYTLSVRGSRVILVPAIVAPTTAPTSRVLVHVRLAVVRLAWRWPFASIRTRTSSPLRKPVRDGRGHG